MRVRHGEVPWNVPYSGAKGRKKMKTRPVLGLSMIQADCADRKRSRKTTGRSRKKPRTNEKKLSPTRERDTQGVNEVGSRSLCWSLGEEG